MTELMAPWYATLKAAHIIFVVFWMAGLFALPRFLVYHQEELADPQQAARWVEREGKLRHIILTPSSILVWLLGIALAFALDAWSAPWLHAKLMLVAVLTAYHHVIVRYAKRLARGEARWTGRTLRFVNEVPGLTLIAIVILVVAKPWG